MNQPPFDPNEGFGPIIFGCVMLVAVIAAGCTGLWIFGGTP